MSTDVNKVLKIKNKRVCLAYCKLLIYFGRLRFRYTVKHKRYNTLQTLQHFTLLSQGYNEFQSFMEGSGTSFSTKFCV